MNISDYRREYAAYRSAIEQEHYKYAAGLQPQLQLQSVNERYADLWTREAVSDLQRTTDEYARRSETEQAGVRVLRGWAQVAYGEAAAGEITSELMRCEAATIVEWQGHKLAAHDIPGTLANESDAARRRELAARWYDHIRRCNDLRAACFDSLRESACSFGFTNRLALCEEITHTSCDKLAAAAENLLEKTASAYRAHLTQWATVAISAAPSSNSSSSSSGQTSSLSELSYADAFFFRRMKELDLFFPAHQLTATYRAAMTNLGIRVEQQTIKIEVNEQPPARAYTACFPISPPNDVRLVEVALSSPGISRYQTFFDEAGSAQYYSWSSGDLAARYPEFVYTADQATRTGHAALFVGLLQDSAWLAEHRGIREEEAQRIARSIRLLLMYEVRRCSAELQYQLKLHNTTDVLSSSQLAETYARLMTEATGFRYSPATYLQNANGWQPAQAYLRGHTFAVALTEHLRTRYGSRWWAKRPAADELIDMWNTASRYSVEELARLTDIGELDFDLLIDAGLGGMNQE